MAETAHSRALTVTSTDHKTHSSVVASKFRSVPSLTPNTFGSFDSRSSTPTSFTDPDTMPRAIFRKTKRRCWSSNGKTHTRTSRAFSQHRRHKASDSIFGRFSQRGPLHPLRMCGPWRASYTERFKPPLSLWLSLPMSGKLNTLWQRPSLPSAPPANYVSSSYTFSSTTAAQPR